MTRYVKIVLSSAILWMALLGSPVQAQPVFKVIKERIDECKDHLDISPYYLVLIGRNYELTTSLGFTEEEREEFLTVTFPAFKNSGEINLSPEEQVNGQIVRCANYAEGILTGVLSKALMESLPEYEALEALSVLANDEPGASDDET